MSCLLVEFSDFSWLNTIRTRNHFFVIYCLYCLYCLPLWANLVTFVKYSDGRAARILPYALIYLYNLTCVYFCHFEIHHKMELTLDKIYIYNRIISLVNKMYPNVLQLNKANTSEKQANFLDLNLSIENGFITTKIYDRDVFDFNIVNYPLLDGDVPCATSFVVYIPQFVRLSRACNNIKNFNERNLCITENLLKQGYRYHKLRETFCKFYRRYLDQLQFTVTTASKYFSTSVTSRFDL